MKRKKLGIRSLIALTINDWNKATAWKLSHHLDFPAPNIFPIFSKLKGISVCV